MTPRFIIANARDNVAIAIADLAAGDVLTNGCMVVEPISAGHKVALTAIASGDAVIKLGQPIGLASEAIAAGAHVHSHNLHFARTPAGSETGVDLRTPEPIEASFDGFVRADGQIGTRNFIGICNPAIDKLIRLVIEAPDREKLINRTRALDRALLWGHYVVPHWHINYYRLAYWNKFSRPEITPKYSLGFFTWWVDKSKENTLLAKKPNLK